MSNPDVPQFSGGSADFRAETTEGREWWLWGFAVLVTLVLTFAIIALVFPGLNLASDTQWLELRDWVRGLAGLVLLFDLYTVYQHLQLYRIRRKLAEKNRLFQLITENADDMIAVVDAEGHRLYNSPAYHTVLGYSPEELKRTNSLEQVHPDDRERLMAAAARARRTGRGERLEYRILHKDGSWRILESTASVVRNGKGEIEHFVIVNRDITERRRAEDLLEYNSLHDGLTRLPNRALLLRQLHRAFAFAKRHSDYNFALLFLDVDGFKLINESLGHEAGDELLVDLAVRLKASLRSLDTVARASRDMVNHSNDTDTGDTGLAKLGGDEYAVLLDDICHPTDAVRVANRLQQILELPFLIRGRELVVSVSLGIAFNQGTYREAPEMLRDAEIAMHRAKKRGKSQYEVFDNAMHTQAIRRLEIETDLRRGIAQGELKVFYQPIVSLESGLIVGLEALSRWQHPSGMIMPAEFIEVADETGLIVPINRQLIREACQALRDWRALSALQPPLFISVNISPRHFADPDLANDVAEILREAGLEPDGIELEILETVAMGDPDTANKTLSKLKEIGVRLSIDDFGTGYSSLGRLQHLPVDTLKIDRSFIAKVESQLAAREIVTTIIHLAHAVNLKVVAEGVEEDSQARRLRDLGCDMAQGFYFGRPAPFETLSLPIKGAASRSASGILKMPTAN